MQASSHWVKANQTSPTPIRLALLDDHALFRQSLARFLSAEPGFEVVGECGAIRRALEILRSSPVDVVLLDFNLGEEHGNDFIAAARAAGYREHFLIVSGTADARSSAAALQLGASGIFLKSESPARLVQAIRLVAAGAAWVDERIVHRLADRMIAPGRSAAPSGLNDREQHVLQGILGGLSNREIGENAGISEGSVKHIVQRLFDKAGVRTRGQLVRAALEGSPGLHNPSRHSAV